MYRVDVHWILSSQEKQNQIENEVVTHLRQIQLWHSVPEMLSFLNDVLTPNYLDRSPELLTLLYEEQCQKRPKVLEMLFSPSKSDTSSVAPSSVMSRTSEVSYKSIPSIKARPYNGPNSGNHAATTNITGVEMRKKLRRHTSFDTQSLQINMIDKKKLGRAAQMSAVGYTIGTNKGQNVNQTRIHTRGRTGQSTKNSSELTNVSNSIRAKRNLSFDDPTLGTNLAMSAYASGLRRSPRKRVVTCDIMSSALVTSQKAVRRTPSKRTPSKTGHVTPFKMTPGKSHQLFAPETPKNKEHNRRKTDGVACVAESPDLDRIKGLGGERTPRRVAASLNLRKKTSFYSGDVSRNLMKAEELMNATQIQSFSMVQHSSFERTRKGSLVQQNKSDNSCDKVDMPRRDSCGVLFPHLVQNNETQKPNESGDSQNKIQTIAD